MSVELAIGTPLANALQVVVEQKLAETTWSNSGLDDAQLAEYILLMVVNGKTQDEIAAELSTELLQLAPEDTGATDFMNWLFEQISVLSGQIEQGVDVASMVAQPAQTEADSGARAITEDGQDTAMDEAVDAQQDDTIPTGPKSMRNGTANARDRRVLGQVNKQLNDAALHKIKGSSGTGRINSHRAEPPKGPRGQAARGQALQGRLQRGPGNGQQQQSNQMPGMLGAMNNMTPQQQMQLMAMYEEQARMMASILSPQQQQMFPGQMAFGGPNAPQPNQGKSLFERVDESNPRQNGGHYNKRQYNNKAHNDAAASDIANDATSSMEVESSSQSKDPATTVCYFNLNCTNPTCIYAHQSPAAPPNTPVDFADICSYGASCKNRKCVGKHPSPSAAAAAAREADCKFFPNCTNPACPFRHPSTPPCRNGADCTVEGCTYAHSKVLCRFDPCLNPGCAFKHAEGQKRGSFQDKVWMNGSGGGEHVSERKFVDDASAQEELILPGGTQEESQETTGSIAPEGIIT